MKIRILDSVHCQVDKSDRKLLSQCLSFKSQFYLQGPFRKVKKERDKVLIDRNGLFLTGFIPRVKNYCSRKKIDLEIVGSEEKLKTRCPYLFDMWTERDVIFREDQLFLIKRATEKQRGFLLSPTGSGKTVVAIGIMSCFPESKILFLCHTRDLVSQTIDELNHFGINPYQIGMVCDGTCELNDFTVATMQSFSKLGTKEFSMFDVVMVDEAHHVSSFDGTYAHILSRMIAPVRLGFTATIPEKEESRLALEGLLGPLIGEVTVDQGISQGFISKPFITLLRPPYQPLVKDYYKYSEIYDAFIVENRARNLLIAKTVKERNDQLKSTLVLVNKIEHGNILKDAILKEGVGCEFVHGSHESSVRSEVKRQLQEKKLRCVIASTIWKEGINIPSLNVIVVASGGKSETTVLQSVGRGLRVFNEKDVIEIIDFLDLGKYISEHTVNRLRVYSENGWL